MRANLSYGIWAILTAIFLAGCGVKCSEYSATAKTVKVLKEYNGVNVTLNKFTALNPGENTQLCRFVKDVITPDKMPYEMYIQNALKEEFMMAGLYEDNAKIRLSGYLQEARGSSMVGDAYWTYRIRISSNNGNYIIVKMNKTFESSYLSGTACDEMANAFAPSIKELVHQIVTHPNFYKLIGDRT
jgi:hypothetical protein